MFGVTVPRMTVLIKKRRKQERQNHQKRPDHLLFDFGVIPEVL